MNSSNLELSGTGIFKYYRNKPLLRRRLHDFTQHISSTNRSTFAPRLFVFPLCSPPPLPSVLRPEGPRWKLERCPHPAASLSLLHQALYVALPLGNPCRAPEARGFASQWRICGGGRSLRALWRWRRRHRSGGCTWRSLRSWQFGDVTDAVGLLTPRASFFFSSPWKHSGNNNRKEEKINRWESLRGQRMEEHCCHTRKKTPDFYIISW